MGRHRSRASLSMAKSKKQSKQQTPAKPPPGQGKAPSRKVPTFPTNRPARAQARQGAAAARKRAFLAAFKQTGIIGHATKAVDIHRDQPAAGTEGSSHASTGRR